MECRGYGIRDCRRCGHRFAEHEPTTDHVNAVYDDGYFNGGGAGYPNYLASGELLTARGREYARLLADYRPAGRILDVGAAAGFLLSGWHAQGWQGEGIEPNAAMAAYARRVLKLDVHAVSLESFQPRHLFDVVSLVQVLPHFVDLLPALQAARRATAPGGYWLIETWDCGSLTARLWGRLWHEYSPPSVLHWFTPDRVSQLAGRLGMVEVARGRPRRPIQLEHARSGLQHALGDGRLARWATTPLKILPGSWSVPYPGDDLFWILLRQEDRAPAAGPMPTGSASS